MIALNRRLDQIERRQPSSVLTVAMARQIADDLDIDPAIVLLNVGKPLEPVQRSQADLDGIAVALGIDPATL